MIEIWLIDVGQVEHHHVGAEYAFTAQSGSALRADRRLRRLDRQPPQQDPAVRRAQHRHLIRQVFNTFISILTIIKKKKNF